MSPRISKSRCTLTGFIHLVAFIIVHLNRLPTPRTNSSSKECNTAIKPKLFQYRECLAEKEAEATSKVAEEVEKVPRQLPNPLLNPNRRKLWETTFIMLAQPRQTVNILPSLNTLSTSSGRPMMMGRMLPRHWSPRFLKHLQSQHYQYHQRQMMMREQGKT